jgi:hypothetical protein
MTEGHTRPRIESFRRTTAKRLRANATEPEQRLWRALRRIPMLGTHFRRQVPIGSHVADIACLAKRLVTVAASAIFLDEAARLNFPQLAIGTLLIVGGAILVTTA